MAFYLAIPTIAHAECPGPCCPAGPSGKNIVDTANQAGSFQTLVAAVEAAGLADALDGEGPFTVFAPTDEAFAALPEGTVESLLMPENRDQLTAILTMHIVPGRVLSGEIQGPISVQTVEGSNVRIDLETGEVSDDARIVTADIEATNGVIHVIDQVILPD